MARDRDNDQDTEKTSRKRSDALSFISDAFGIDIDFDKPPDPFRGGLPLFRIEGPVPFSTPACKAPLPATARVLNVQIRLDRPLAPQMAELERLAFQQAPRPKAPAFRRRPTNYVAYLRVLDAIEDGATVAEAAAVIFPGEGGAKRFAHSLKAARKLTQGGYLELIRRHVTI